jgi:hypothetical protein
LLFDDKYFLFLIFSSRFSLNKYVSANLYALANPLSINIAAKRASKQSASIFLLLLPPLFSSPLERYR